MNTKGNIHDLESALVDIIKYIDTKWKWLSKDENGEFNFHTEEPYLGGYYSAEQIIAIWRSEGDAELLGLTLPYDQDWKECLVNLEEVRGND